MQQFFTDTIESKFIKELLYKSNLPLLTTKSSGDYIVKDFFYIYDGSIIKCTKSGNIGDDGEFSIYDDYELGKKYLNLTENHISKYNYYDTDTHEKLGDYLRVLRDVRGIDLMPYYNCFSYKTISGFEISSYIDISKYSKYTIVSDDENYYVSKKDRNTYSIEDTSYWNSTPKSEVQPFYNYEEFDFVYIEGEGSASMDYYCVNKTGRNTTTSPRANNDPTNWTTQTVVLPWPFIGYYDVSKYTLVTNNNKYYVNKTGSHKSIPPADDIENWVEKETKHWSPQPSISYDEYALVSYKDNIYTSKIGSNTNDLLTSYWSTNTVEEWEKIHTMYTISTNSTSRYKLLVAPVRFGKTYTISLECPTEVIISQVFYNEFGLNSIIDDDVDILKKWYEDQSISIQGMRFKHPITKTIEIGDLDESIAQAREKDLYLVVQVPATNNSSILIQEGDYTSLPHFNDYDGTQDVKVGFPSNFSLVYSMETPREESQQNLNKLLLSPLSLQRMNTGTSYAFADRLVEYLLLNVIDKDEQIDNNIELAQNVVELKKGTYTNGVWNNPLRLALYQKFTRDFVSNRNKKVEFIDINGFVDKDTEYLLGV